MTDLFNDMIGKKFRTDGRGPNFYDCYGAIKECAKRIGFELPEQKTPEGVKLRLKMFESIASEYTVPIDKPESYCVVVFSGIGTGGLHIGMVLENKREFIHAGGIVPAKKSVRIDRLDCWPWESRIQGYFKLTKKSEPIKCKN